MSVKDFFKKAASFNFDNPCAKLGIKYVLVNNGVFLASRWLQHAKNDDGLFIAPQFLRYHLTNLTDVFGIGCMLNLVCMTSVLLGQKNRPVATGGVTLAMGTAWEVFQSVSNKAPLDVTDLACYGISYGLFIAAFRHVEKVSQNGQGNLPKPVLP